MYSPREPPLRALRLSRYGLDRVGRDCRRGMRPYGHRRARSYGFRGLFEVSGFSVDDTRLVLLYAAQLSGGFLKLGVADRLADPHSCDRAKCDPHGDDANYPPEHRDSMTRSVTVHRRLSLFRRSKPVM